MLHKHFSSIFIFPTACLSSKTFILLFIFVNDVSPIFNVGVNAT